MIRTPLSHSGSVLESQKSSSEADLEIEAKNSLNPQTLDPDRKMEAEENRDCVICSEEVLCMGQLEKRTGFNCAVCQKASHFKCAGVSDMKNGCLPKAVLVFINCSAMKLPFEKLLFCEDCSADDFEDCSADTGTSSKSAPSAPPCSTSADPVARAAIQKLEQATSEISAKLGFLVDFLAPADLPEGKMKDNQLGQQQHTSYSSAAQKGVTGLSGLVTYACVEAQKQMSEAEMMARTVIADGVPETNDSSPWNDAKSLLAMLNLRELIPQEVHRLGQNKGSKPRKLKIICQNVFDHDYLLGNRVRQGLRHRNFPVQGIFLNPSTPGSERREGFLLRCRRNELNKGVSEENQFFVYRPENRLVRKIDGRVDWNWSDDDFPEWVRRFEEKEERQRSERSSQRQDQNQNQNAYSYTSNSKSLLAGGKRQNFGWRTVGPGGRVRNLQRN